VCQQSAGPCDVTTCCEPLNEIMQLKRLTDDWCTAVPSQSRNRKIKQRRICSAHGPKFGLVTIANAGLHLETRVTRPDILLKLLISCYFTWIKIPYKFNYGQVYTQCNCYTRDIITSAGTPQGLLVPWDHGTSGFPSLNRLWSAEIIIPIYALLRFRWKSLLPRPLSSSSDTQAHPNQTLGSHTILDLIMLFMYTQNPRFDNL